jgi:hypothetical protein
VQAQVGQAVWIAINAERGLVFRRAGDAEPH